MATKTKQTENEFAMDEQPEMPTEFNDDPTDEVEPLDHDALMSMGFDHEADARDYAAINPPGGDWRKGGRFERQASAIGSDKQPGDMSPNGRYIVSYKGKPEEREVGNVTHQPTLFFRVSRDARARADDPNKPDGPRKLFLSAKELFIKMKGREPSNVGEVFLMLEEDDYTVVTWQSGNGLVVTGFKQMRN